jgi:DNA-binding transcriptional LysR family regulator
LAGAGLAFAPRAKLTSRREHHLVTSSRLAERQLLRNEWALIRKQSMDWDNLRFFLALAESGSLSRASEKLRVDHSTVARRIGMLEQELGVRLVERLPRSYRLTAEGELIRKHAKKIEACIGDVASVASSVDLSLNRVVRVNGPPTFLSHFLAPRLLSLQSHQPGLRIELTGEARQISLSQGEADVAIRMSKPLEKGVIARRLAVVGYGLFGSRDYLARCGEDAREFLGFDGSIYAPARRWLEELTGGRDVVFRSNDLANLLMGARAGLGLAVLPCIMARTHPELINVPTRLPPPRGELWLLFQRDVGRTPAVRMVIDHITAITTKARAAFLGEQAGARVGPKRTSQAASGVGTKPLRQIG